MITVLCGGVGAAKLLAGLIRVVAPEDVTAVVNTGDDLVRHGLRICPDLDTVTYTLAGAVNQETGWGLAGETWRAMEVLARYGGADWFRLGDGDLGTHLYRTGRLADGVALSTVTTELARGWGVTVRLLPVSDDDLRTMVTVPGEGEIAFQDYFVARRHAVPVSAVRVAGSEAAVPAPGVLDAIAGADAVVIAPSNPIVSVGPLLAVPGIAEALAARRDETVAISPIVAGAALKGPADRLLAELGHEPSVVGVARLYASLAATLMVDDADAPLAPHVEGAGMRCVATPAIMRTVDDAAALAAATLRAAGVEP